MKENEIFCKKLIISIQKTIKSSVQGLNLKPEPEPEPEPNRNTKLCSKLFKYKLQISVPVPAQSSNFAHLMASLFSAEVLR